MATDARVGLASQDGFLRTVPQARVKLTGKERVRKREDIARLLQRGARYHTDQYTLIVSRSGLGVARIAVSVKKKIGNAVMRNYEKRLVRECFRREKGYIPKGVDLLVIVKQATGDFSSSSKKLQSLLRRSLF